MLAFKVSMAENLPVTTGDNSLLEYLQTLSPEERLKLNDSAASAALELRAAFDDQVPERKHSR
jgi:hypothetical protein